MTAFSGQVVARPSLSIFMWIILLFECGGWQIENKKYNIKQYIYIYIYINSATVLREGRISSARSHRSNKCDCEDIGSEERVIH